jgi:hypothetical protein
MLDAFRYQRKGTGRNVLPALRSCNRNIVRIESVYSPSYYFGHGVEFTLAIDAFRLRTSSGRSEVGFKDSGSLREMRETHGCRRVLCGPVREMFVRKRFQGIWHTCLIHASV